LDLVEWFLFLFGEFELFDGGKEVVRQKIIILFKVGSEGPNGTRANSGDGGGTTDSLSKFCSHSRGPRHGWT
jgi:hypothetical protein